MEESSSNLQVAVEGGLVRLYRVDRKGGFAIYGRGERGHRSVEEPSIKRCKGNRRNRSPFFERDAITKPGKRQVKGKRVKRGADAYEETNSK